MSAADLDPFRDPILGAESYRRTLLRARRDDLAELPPVVREVAVRRAGRIGGGMAATLTAGALGLLAAVAYLWGFPEGVNALFPGPVPAPLATLLLVACVATPIGVLLGRAAGERAWRRAMSRCVMPGGNVADDIDRLAVELPLGAGRRLALRIEGASVALPVLGAMLLGPALVVAARGAVVAAGYPEVAALEDALLRLAPWQAFAGIGGLVVALVLRGGLRHWTTAQLGRNASVFAGIGVLLVPLLAVAGAAALLGAFALLAVRRERRRLGLRDGDAVAFDAGLGRGLAGAARTSWTFLARAVARARALVPTRRRVLVLVALAVGVGFGIGLATIPARTLAPIPVLVTLPPEPADVPAPIRVPVVDPPAAAAPACVCP